VNSRGDRGVLRGLFLLTAGVDVQLTEKYLVISDPLIDPLRRLEIARQIEALETELQGDGPVKRN